MMNKIHILMLCGFGDTLSVITRIPDIENKYPDYSINFYLGGFGKSPQFSKEQLERELRHKESSVQVIDGLVYHNQLPAIKQFIKSNLVKDNDVFFDFSFCEEIFKNQDPPQMQFSMEDRYVFCESPVIHTHEEFEKQIYSHDDLFDVISNFYPYICIQALTKSGNAEGFQADLANGRFWKQEEWKKLIDLLVKSNLVPFFVGAKEEDWGLVEYCKEKNYKHYDATGVDIRDTMYFLKHSQGCIACNSWSWEVTAHKHIPTICFYTKNHFFLKLHTPQKRHPFYDTCYIETSNVVSAEDIFKKFMYIYDTKTRPNINYSICMITLNDEKVLDKTLLNIRDNSNKNLYVVDGGSTDDTLSMLEDAQAQVFHNTWPENFEIQKNLVLSKASTEWRILIDSDETFEPLLWNQLPWYIWEAEQKGIDCIQLPRINTLSDISHEELVQYSQKNGWQLAGINWINYPDYQQRLFKSNCSYVGKTHEVIIGFKNQVQLVGLHIIHEKTKERQDKGLERERKQYIQVAKEVKKRIMEAENGI
jgi:hypothetical protein